MEETSEPSAMYLLAYANVNKRLASYSSTHTYFLKAFDTKHLTAVCKEKHTFRGCYGLTSTDPKWSRG